MTVHVPGEYPVRFSFTAKGRAVSTAVLALFVARPGDHALFLAPFFGNVGINEGSGAMASVAVTVRCLAHLTSHQAVAAGESPSARQPLRGRFRTLSARVRLDT